MNDPHHLLGTRALLFSALSICLGTFSTGCFSDATTCGVDNDCFQGELCEQGQCVPSSPLEDVTPNATQNNTTNNTSSNTSTGDNNTLPQNNTQSGNNGSTNNTSSDEPDMVAPSAAPDIDAPGAISFTQVEPGSTRAETFELENTGDAPLNIFGVTLSPTESPFSVSWPSPDAPADPTADAPSWSGAIEPGEARLVRITFAPTTGSNVEASLEFSSDDPDESIKIVRLVGSAGSPCVELQGADGAPGQRSLDFGEQPLGAPVTRALKLSNCSQTSDLDLAELRLTENANGAFTLVSQTVPTLPATLAPGTGLELLLEYEGARAGATDRGTLVIGTNDATEPRAEIALTGSVEPERQCPRAIATARDLSAATAASNDIDVEPLATILLDGSQSTNPNGPPVSGWSWSLVSAPEGSTTILDPTLAQAVSTQLFIDMPGTYTVDLEVETISGEVSCSPARVTIEAIPSQDIYVVLYWDTPSDQDQTDGNGADLDIHYLLDVFGAEWGFGPYDIFWQNTTANWGNPGPGDDPVLVRKDPDGAGPEIVAHDRPQNRDYYVGAYYYDDLGFGPSDASVLVYIKGQLILANRATRLPGTGWFWEAAHIEWGVNPTVTPLDEVDYGFF